MQVTIISDTHIYSIKNLPPKVLTEIKNADAVIHAGDMVGKNFYNELKGISKTLFAVKGNMDTDITEIEEVNKFTLGHLRIGLTHGHIYNNLYNGLIYNFTDCDLVIFGHTHSPYFKKEGNVWLINPGSTSKNRWKNINSYAILNIYDKDFTVTFYDI